MTILINNALISFLSEKNFISSKNNANLYIQM